MDFGRILSRAWGIFWKHRALWLFGILAGCGSSGSSAPNLQASYRENFPLEWQRYFRIDFPDWQAALIIGVVLLVVLVLVILAIFLSTMGRIGLIRGTMQIEGGSSSLAFGELFNSSLPYFWRVFGLNLLVGIVVAVLGIMFVLLAIFGTVLTLGVLLLCLIPIICLLAPLSWFLSIVVEQSIIAIVVDDLDVLGGLQRGWDVVRANIGPIIVMGLILLLGVGLVGGFIIGLPVVFIIVPALLGAIADTPRAMGGALLIAGICLVGYLPVWIFLNGMLRGYIETSWTLTYLELTGRASAPEAIAPEPA